MAQEVQREEVEDDHRSGRPSTSRTDENVERVRQEVRSDRPLSVRMIGYELAGAPRAERGPGDSSNVTELWFCKVQNKREKMLLFGPKNDVISKKKVFSEISTIFSSQIK